MKQRVTSRVGGGCVVASVALVFHVAAGAALANIIIDDFNDIAAPHPWPVTHASVTTTTITETGLAGTLGGVRTTTIETNLLGTPGLDFTQTTIVPGVGVSGVFDFNSTVSAQAQLSLLYDGGNDGLNADFSSQLGIFLGVLKYDQGWLGPNLLRVTVSDGANAASMLKVNDIIASGTFFAFSMFSGIGNVDLTSIKSVKADFIHGATGIDFRLYQIRTIAIPGPGAIALLGLAGVHARRRRQMN